MKFPVVWGSDLWHCNTVICYSCFGSRARLSEDSNESDCWDYNFSRMLTYRGGTKALENIADKFLRVEAVYVTVFETTRKSKQSTVRRFMVHDFRYDLTCVVKH